MSDNLLEARHLSYRRASRLRFSSICRSNVCSTRAQWLASAIALRELSGHVRIVTTMVDLRRKDREREMETVRGV